jgi:polar amino acid transport system substrate-binding protein
MVLQKWLAITSYFFFAFILMASPVPVWSSEKLPMGTFEFPPFNYTDEGEVVGAGTAVVKTILNKLGYTLDITSYPWKRTLEMADEGEVAGLFTFTSNERRVRSNYLTDPIATIYDVFFKRKDEEITWNEISDLKETLIGATDGYNYAPVFLSPLKAGELKIDIIASKNPELLHLKKITAGRIDLAIC